MKSIDMTFDKVILDRGAQGWYVRLIGPSSGDLKQLLGTDTIPVPVGGSLGLNKGILVIQGLNGNNFSVKVSAR